MDGLQRESLTADQRDALIGTSGSEPVPGEQAFDHHDDPLSIRGNGLQAGIQGGFHLAMHEHLAALVEEAEIHGAGMLVNAAVIWLLRGVQSPCGLLLMRDPGFPTLSIPRWSAGEGASISIKRLLSTPYNVRCAPAFGSSSCPAFGVPDRGRTLYQAELLIVLDCLSMPPRLCCSEHNPQHGGPHVCHSLSYFRP
jgi:hypothetical protein